MFGACFGSFRFPFHHPFHFPGFNLFLGPFCWQATMFDLGQSTWKVCKTCIRPPTKKGSLPPNQVLINIACVKKSRSLVTGLDPFRFLAQALDALLTVSLASRVGMMVSQLIFVNKSGIFWSDREPWRWATRQLPCKRRNMLCKEAS